MTVEHGNHPILTAAGRWCGVPYGHTSRSDRSKVDCSTLTAHIIDEAVVPLDPAAWADVVLADGSKPWSPIERAVADRWGQEPPGDPTRPLWAGWYLVQGWRTIPTDGHAMLAHYDGAALRVLEATNKKAADGRPFGVRWRGSASRAVAPLSITDAPALLVEDFCADYPAGVRWARLVGL